MNTHSPLGPWLKTIDLIATIMNTHFPQLFFDGKETGKVTKVYDAGGRLGKCRRGIRTGGVCGFTQRSRSCGTRVLIRLLPAFRDLQECSRHLSEIVVGLVQLVTELQAHVDYLLARFPEVPPEHLHHTIMRNDPFWVRFDGGAGQ